MLFIPKNNKNKKHQKGKAFNKIKQNRVSFYYGQIGLKALSFSRITSKQLITLYMSIKKRLKKKGKILIRIFPQLSVTKKPIEVRMGKGKGPISFWVSKVSPGSVLCEISTPFSFLALKILNKVRLKLAIKTKVVFRKN